MIYIVLGARRTLKPSYVDCQCLPISKKYRHSSVGDLRVEIYLFEVSKVFNHKHLILWVGLERLKISIQKAQNLGNIIKRLLQALPDSQKVEDAQQS